MTGKQKDFLADIAGVFEVSEYDDWKLQISMVPTDENETEDMPEDVDDLWVLDEIEEPGRYVLVRSEDRSKRTDG